MNYLLALSLLYLFYKLSSFDNLRKKKKSKPVSNKTSDHSYNKGLQTRTINNESSKTKTEEEIEAENSVEMLNNILNGAIEDNPSSKIHIVEYSEMNQSLIEKYR